jgi:hypothetical protein
MTDTYGPFMRSERTGMLEKTGRWDEALALSLDILDRAAPAPVTRLCPTTRAGTLMARRGEDRAGWKAGPPTPSLRPDGPTKPPTPTMPGPTAR